MGAAVIWLVVLVGIFGGVSCSHPSADDGAKGEKAHGRPGGEVPSSSSEGPVVVPDSSPPGEGGLMRGFAIMSPEMRLSTESSCAVAAPETLPSPDRPSLWHLRGLCLEERKDWLGARDAYRSVLTSDAGQKTAAGKGLRASALYRLSFVWEALQKPEKMYATLKDAEKLKPHLPALVRDVGLPARQGVALVQLKRWREAQELFRKSDSKSARYVESEQDRAALAELLRGMGASTLHHLPLQDLSSMEAAATSGQKFLLRALELDPRLRDSVTENLSSFYLRGIDALQLEARRDLHAALLNLLDLGSQTLPGSDPLRSEYEKWEQRARQITFQPQVQVEATEDSRKRALEKRRVRQVESLPRK